jgi:hypothetical protein
MSERCPACGAEQAFLPIYPSLLHCNACGESMIVRPPGPADLEVTSTQEEISAFDRWSASALVDLVSRIPELQRTGSLAQMRQNLVLDSETSSAGSVTPTSFGWQWRIDLR